MDKTALESCLDSIETAFEQEAEHIVRGQVLQLGDTTQAKLEQMNMLSNAIEAGALRDQPASLIQRVQKLQNTALEHDRHLQAMRHGLIRVRERLDRLQSDSNVGSYDQYGSRVQFSGARGRFESKA